MANRHAFDAGTHGDDVSPPAPCSSTLHGDERRSWPGHAVLATHSESQRALGQGTAGGAGGGDSRFRRRTDGRVHLVSRPHGSRGNSHRPRADQYAPELPNLAHTDGPTRRRLVCALLLNRELTTLP